MKRTISGFTIVEVLVIVTVIGILGSIGLMSFTSIQNQTNDSSRASQIKVVSNALEKYYQKNGQYPSCPEMTGSASSVASMLGGLDPAVLKAPGDTARSNSFVCTEPGSEKDFSYLRGGRRYILKYKQKDNGEVKVVNSAKGEFVKIEIAVLGAGGGGGGGDFYCPAIAGPGGNGGNSSIRYDYKNMTFTSYGGFGGLPCYVAGDDKGVLISNAGTFINTANPIEGGGSEGGFGGEDSCGACLPETGGKGGSGGKISGTFTIRAGEELDIVVGAGGSGGEPYPSSDGYGYPGNPGSVIIRYPTALGPVGPATGGTPSTDGVYSVRTFSYSASTQKFLLE